MIRRTRELIDLPRPIMVCDPDQLIAQFTHELLSIRLMTEICFIHIQIFRSLQNRPESIFAHGLHGMYRQLRINQLFINPFSIQFYMRSTGCDQSVKADRKQIRVRDISTRAPTADKCIVSICTQCPDCTHRTLRDHIMKIPQRSIDIKKYCFTHDLISNNFAFSSFSIF